MRLFYLLFLIFLLVPLRAGELEKASTPADNALKGFMPYEGVYLPPRDFPHSMEWFYLPLRDLQKDYDQFDWQPLEAKLDAIAGRGHQAVFRIYLDYPQHPYGVPEFLGHVPKRAYSEHGNGENPQRTSFSPDHEHPDLRRALKSFIAAFGKRYDGDARIGFITVGLLGFWGEWHTYPHTQGEDNWMASGAVQNEVLDVYEKAFRKTKLLLREPKPDIDIANRALGFHDDSFAYQTLGPEEWHFWPKVKAFGLTERWKTQPIGGEVRPEVQSCMWNGPNQNCVPPGQEYERCVQVTHASWMLNQGAFNELNAMQKERAIAGARSLGYELWVQRAEAQFHNETLQVEIAISNEGVAPFYYDWPLELAIANGKKQIVARFVTDWKLSSVLPGEVQTWKINWKFASRADLPPQEYVLLLRAVNPLANGKVLHFANQTQNATLPGWLSLATFKGE